MKVIAKGKILAITPKEGKTGKYNAVVLLVEDEVLNTYSKNDMVQVSPDEVEVVLNLKKYQGKFSSFEILGTRKLS